MKNFVITLVGVIAISSVLAGCQQKFTRQNYDTIYIGQPAQQVEMTLGKPDVKFDSQWNYINEEPFYKAIIKIENGKVADKSWADERVIEDHPDGNKGKPFRNTPPK